MKLLLIFNASILPIFIIVAIAVVYERLAKPDILQITNLTLTIFAPIFVFDALVKTRISLEMLVKPVIFMAALTAALMLLAYGTAKLLKARENERTALILSCSMINVGNFGLPLIYFTYGNTAEAYSVLYFVAFNIPLSTVAIYISSREKRVTKILKDICRIPLFHSLLLALLVSQLSVPVPSAIAKSLHLVGLATIPLLIFILGLQLSKIRMTAAQIRFMTPAVLIRLVISPILALLILKGLDIGGIEKNVAAVQTSAPSALLPLMYAIRFNRSPDLLAAIIMVTTLFSGISLTVLIHLLSG